MYGRTPEQTPSMGVCFHPAANGGSTIGLDPMTISALRMRRQSRSNHPLGMHARLRQATAQTHAMLDKQFGRFDLRQRSEYRQFLEVSAAALLPLEEALVQAGVEHIFPDWPLRSRSSAILDDLARLGGTVAPVAVLPPLNFGQLLGTMYVLEGSRLGAQILLKRASQSDDPVVAAATAYLSHGTGQHLWRSFLVMLERHAATLNRTISKEQDVINGACQAFALFEQAAAKSLAASPANPAQAR